MTDEQSTKFDPGKHMSKLKGKDYLEVKWRVLWFRTDHPAGSIQTEMLSMEPPVFKASVINSDGICIATGHGTGAKFDRPFEKAETAAIGRALANAGYGTQFTGEDESDMIVDAPMKRSTSNGAGQGKPQPKPEPHSWATEANLDILLAMARKQYPGVTRTEFAEAAGIPAYKDYAAWNKAFKSGADAGKAALDQLASDPDTPSPDEPPRKSAFSYQNESPSPRSGEGLGEGSKPASAEMRNELTQIVSVVYAPSRMGRGKYWGRAYCEDEDLTIHIWDPEDVNFFTTRGHDLGQWQLNSGTATRTEPEKRYTLPQPIPVIISSEDEHRIDRQATRDMFAEQW